MDATDDAFERCERTEAAALSSDWPPPAPRCAPWMGGNEPSSTSLPVCVRPNTCSPVVRIRVSP